MKRYFLQLLILLAINAAVFAQKQGDEAGVGFGVQEPNHSVDLSSGVLNISVPLGNQVLPMALSYSAGGIKVNQISGPYGLGWNLSAEAFISREVRGLPDENENGYSGKNKRGLSANRSLTYESGMNFFFYQTWDPEPDIFRYNLMGYSGVFIINPNRTAVKLTHDNVKIIPKYYEVGSGSYYFEIIDPNGNKYTFGRKEIISNQVDSDPQFSYTYKWHLTTVDFYNSTKQLSYKYVPGQSYTTTTLDKSGSREIDSSDPLDISTESIKNTYKPMLIQGITSDRNSVLFEYDERIDLTNSKKLHAIDIQQDGVSYERYEFNYEYFENEGTKRLKLKSIEKVVPDQTTKRQLVALFRYFGEDNNEYILPEYNSNRQDHWGYYNANPVNTLIEDQGAVRSPSLDQAKACTIKKVLFPTGKTEEYEFELNSYNIGRSNRDAGGLRISKVITTDQGETTSYARSYSYNSTGISTGELYRSPVYIREYYMRGHGGRKYLEWHKTRSLSPLSDLFGRHVVYRRVTLENPDGSKTEYDYKTFDDERDIFSAYPSRYLIKMKYSKNGYLETTALPQNEDIPYGYFNMVGNLAGLVEKITYTDSDGNPIKEELFDYDYYYGESTNYGISNLAIRNHFFVDNQFIEYYIGKYKIKPYYFKLSSKTTTAYDHKNTGNFSQTITEFSYDYQNFLPSRVKTYLSGYDHKNSIKATHYLISSSLGVSNVDQHNLMNAVSREYYLVNNKVQSKTEHSYENDEDGDVVLIESKGYVGGDKLVSHQSHTYNQAGASVQVTDELTGQQSSIIYDNDYINAIATVNNGSKDRIAYSSFELNERGNWNVPTLVTSEECSAALIECQNACNGNSTCIQNCYIEYYSNCLNSVNISNQGRTGKYSYNLGKANITKTGLPQIKYTLSYWYRSGAVSVSGVSSNTLLSTFSNGGWTYNERKIQLSSSTLTLSGTAIIDELRLYPENASMTTKTNTFWGPSSETDINNMSAFVEYDDFGRVKYLKDFNKDIIKANEYNFGNYLFTGAEAFAADGGGEVIYFDVYSNAPWTINENVSWISLSVSRGSGDRRISVTCFENTSGRSRSGTITIQSGEVTRQLTITQERGPFINCPYYVTLSSGNKETDIKIASNISWTISNIQYVQGGTRWLGFSKRSGTGTQTLKISAGYAPRGETHVARFDVTGSGIKRTVTVAYSNY
jgi:hypothetical protein